MDSTQIMNSYRSTLERRIASLKKLDIKKGSSTSEVTVSYDLCFSYYEVKDETTFIDTVSLHGDDVGPDDNLGTIFRSCVKAKKACITRKFTRKIKNSVLNEDDGWLNKGDEVYAKVVLTPFVSSSRVANSNIISSRF